MADVGRKSRTDATKMDGSRGNHSREINEESPPNSRLFIVCDKCLTEERFREAFSPFGDIEDVWVVKDKNTGEAKGVTYIKFAKTSQAADALENMNGKIIKGGNSALKVLVASSRSDGRRRDANEGDKLLRLFVVVPKHYTEDELNKHFKEFGEISDIMIVKDKRTGTSKGFAYIRYLRASHAARAFENCDQSFKPMFADPRPAVTARTGHTRSSTLNSSFDSNYDNYDRGPNYNQYNNSDYMYNNDDMFGFDQGNGFEGGRLQVYASIALSEQQLWRLFDLVPGLEFCDVHSRNYGPRRDLVFATVKYRSAQSASWAKDKLNNFEYPPGSALVVKEGGDLFANFGNSNGHSNSMASAGVGSEIAKLADALAQAQSIIQAAGLNPNTGFRPNDDFDPNYCSARLPNPQPMAPSDSIVAQRLFIVCSPNPPPMYALKDVFGRFGGLMDVYMLHGKNCGYVKYTSKDAADRAINVVHGKEIMGKRMKVMLAEPNERSNSSGLKRLRTEET